MRFEADATVAHQLRTDNTFRGGPGSFTRVSGDGARTTAGDGAKALSTDLRHWSGTFQCASAVRPIEGELQYDGNGGVTSGTPWASTVSLAVPVLPAGSAASAVKV